MRFPWLSRWLLPNSRPSQPRRRRPLQLERLETREVPAAFTKGDIFLGLGNGQIEEHRPDGTLVQTLNSGLGGEMTGMAFDQSNNLYATAFTAGTVVKFDSNGNLLGRFGSGYSGSPESILFDASGNVYVGAVNGDNAIRKFDPAGNPLATFNVQVDQRGSDWIDLAADQHTMFYTSEGTQILRFDVASRTQLPNFTSSLPATVSGENGPRAFQLRLLSDGGALVADNTAILRLNSAGQIVQTYDVAGQDNWFALNLDPDGTSFWSANDATGRTFKFDIATGNVLAQFSPSFGGGSTEVAGLVVLGQITQAVPNQGNQTSGVTSTRPPGAGPCNNPNQCFVSALYQQVLGGQPDTQGFNFWVNALNTGQFNRDQVASMFLNSTERLNLVVESFYVKLLHRHSDPQGKQFWVQTLQNGASEANVVVAFVTSPEYTQSHPTPASYVLGLYADILGRLPSPAELAQQTQNLVSGVIDRGAMAFAFLASPETFLSAITTDFQCYLRRSPTQAEQQALLLALETTSTTPNAFTAHFFLGTDAYFGLVQVVPVASLDFCI
jgi:hypothetical protein